jgi:septal ring factor EnvC (AmiA/AmiB activator)
MLQRGIRARAADAAAKVVMNGAVKTADPSEELLKLRATLAKMQEDMEEIARARDRFESDLKQSQEENAELREENSRLLAQADARAALMQTIQSTLARAYLYISFLPDLIRAIT